MAQAARYRIRRAGRTGRGDPLWTPEEDEIVRQQYPDYRALQRALRRRSYSAIRNRARHLDVVKRRHVWTAREVSFVRRYFLTTTTAELRAAFPGFSWYQIAGKARHIGLRGRKPRLKRTGDRLIDDLLTRTASRGWSLVDLDAISGTRRYFQRQGWRYSRMSGRALLKAIEALDGEITISWQ